MATIRKFFPLFLISALSLYLEVALIRWLGAEIRILAYFKNLVLLAAFLGLAIGFSQVGKGKEQRFTFPALWFMLAAIVVGFTLFSENRSIFYPGSGDEMFWNVGDYNYWLTLILFIASIIVFFLLSMFVFIPLGQAVGEEMAQHKPIPAYIANILASLAGVWAFSLMSYLQTPPWVWFGLGLAGVAAYYAMLRKLTPAMLGLLGASVVVLFIPGWFSGDRETSWSPYNRLDVTELAYIRESDGQRVSLGYIVDVQQTFHQAALNLSPEFIQELRDTGETARPNSAEEAAIIYGRPFRLVVPQSRVLVVGSGTGNDVAAALRFSMGEIDAVEIDPGIIKLGIALHPEQPYSSPQVNLVNDDARSFFRTTQEKYDLVVFGLLDSHTLLSGMSSVRLDSYVYTLESLELVRGLLTENGVVSITFATNEWIEERLGRMMAQVFGQEQLYFTYSTLGTTFVAGPISPQRVEAEGLTAWQPDPAFTDLPLTTDDWPYLYLRGRVIPAGYIQTLAVIALVCLAIMKRSYPGSLRLDWHFFLLGAAFLLIEFKAVTELALLFGTTWFVNSLAISGVLVMALGANLFVLRRKKVNLGWAYGLLFASILLGGIIPLEAFAGLPGIWKGLGSVALLSLPLLFAGVIFSESLRRAGETAGPLASNFAGSAAGGLLEYGSLLWGVKSLYLIAALLYLGAGLVRRLQGK